MSLPSGGDDLIALAHSRRPADRERLLAAIAALCDGDGAGIVANPAIQTLLNSILMSLVVEAERDLRRRLAEKLAQAPWAPPALINVLALDEIEIARPVIAQSPILQDHDLVRLLVEATIEHQIAVARRPDLSETVVSAILVQAEPAVLTALAGNTTARLGDQDMSDLVELARTVAALRAPLAAHPRLSKALAERLYLWVAQALRQQLVERFTLDAAALDALLADTLGDTLGEAQRGGADARLVIVARDGEREAMELRLIDKLHAAGQLRPGYLVRALRENRLTLFCTAMAMLGRFEQRHVRGAIDGDQPELLALACAAVGIDRSVFPAILEMVRGLNDGLPGGGQEGARRAAGAFAPVTPTVAAQAFRQAASAARAV